jgi:hypothetical protein
MRQLMASSPLLGVAVGREGDSGEKEEESSNGEANFPIEPVELVNKDDFLLVLNLFFILA